VIINGLRRNQSPSQPLAAPQTCRRKQRRGQRAHLLVSGAELALDERLRTRQNVAVDVVQQFSASRSDIVPRAAGAGAQTLEQFRQEASIPQSW